MDVCPNLGMNAGRQQCLAQFLRAFIRLTLNRTEDDRRLHAQVLDHAGLLHEEEAAHKTCQHPLCADLLGDHLRRLNAILQRQHPATRA